MAEAEGEEVFKALGKVEVDLDALKKSLRESERITKESMDRHAKLMADVGKPEGTFGGALGTRTIGGGEGSGGTAREAGKQAREFTHLTRTLRELLAGPLIALDPAFAKAANAAAYAARSSLHFGVALGAVAVAGVLVSEVLGEYLKQAKEATQVTVDAGQALKMMDASRAEASIRKISETLALYNVQIEITEGKIEATFFQKMLAWWDRMKEAVTGSVDIQIAHLKELIKVQEEIANSFKLPKAIAGAAEAAAKLSASVAQDQIKAASSTEELATANDRLKKSLEEANFQKIEGLKLDKAREIAANPAVVAANAAADKITQEAKSAYSKAIFAITENERMSPGYRGSKRAEADRQRAENEQTAALKRAEEQRAASKGIIDSIEKESALKIKEANDQLANSLRKNAEQEIADFERVAQANAKTAQVMQDSEQQILNLRRAQLGQVETVDQLERRLSATREQSLGPLRDALDFATQQYEANKKSLEEQIQGFATTENLSDEEKDKLARNRESLKDIETGFNQFKVANARRTAEETAKIAAREEQERIARGRAEVERETKTLAHRVALGRATMEEQIDAARRGMVDPRRSLDEQRKSEEDLFALKQQYAEKYFALFNALGANTWQQQLQFAENMLSQTVEGTAKWFEAAQKVADVYKNIHDTAKGIATTAIGIAEAEARRQGRTRISRGDIASLVSQARQRDVRALSGGNVELGALGTALGRQDFYREMDRMGMTPGAALVTAMGNPQQQLAETIGRVSTVAGTAPGAAKEGAEQVGGLGSASGEAASALRDFTEAVRTATGAVGDIAGGMGGNPRGEMEAADRQSMEETRKRARISSNNGKSWEPLPTVQEAAIAYETRRGAKRGVQP